MYNFPAILIANGTALLMMVLLLINMLKIGRTGFPDERLFIAMVLFTIFQAILEPVTFLMEARIHTGYHALLLFSNAFLYLINILFAFTWIIYVDYKTHEDRKRLFCSYRLICLPGLAVIIGAIVNLFTPVFFSISDANIYDRTPFFLLPYIVTYLYLAYGVAMIYVSNSRTKKYLRLPALLFMIPILTCSLIQYFNQGYSLIWLGVAVAVLFLYINLQNETSYIDELSGLYTRQYLHNYMHMHMARANSTRRLGGIMLDIDGFKEINDRQGHMTGDMAIATVGRLLREAIDGDGFAVRYGGDEFVVLAWMTDEVSLQHIVEAIRRQEKAYNQNVHKDFSLLFSIGSSLYKNGETLDAFLSRMDQRMYADKRSRIKRRLIADRRSTQRSL